MALEARPITPGLPRRVETTACRVERRGSDIVFGGEEPIGIQVQWRPVGAEPGVGLWRFEVKVKEPSGDAPTGPSACDELLCAEVPRANGWLARARFKRGDRHGRDGAPRVESGDDRVERLLSQRSTDPWEQGKWLTAAIDEGPDQYLLADKIRNFGQDAFWVFGVCDDFESMRNEVVASDRAKELLLMTAQGRLRLFAPVGGGAKVRQSRSVHPRAVDDAARFWIAAVSQSFAGPLDSEMPPRHAPRDKTGWLGQPVIELAERVYRDHMYNASRRFDREDRRG